MKMGFRTILEAAAMPVMQVLIICVIGAFLATDYFNILPPDALRQVNKVVFAVFTPSLTFSSVAKTVTLHEIISWWFMPVSIGLTFVIGGVLGWILVKVLKPKPKLKGLVIATCSTGNVGELPLIIIPAVCNQEGSPFGSSDICRTVGLSYVAFSMAIAGLFIWSYTYNVIQASAKAYEEIKAANGASHSSKNGFASSVEKTLLLQEDDHQLKASEDLEEPTHDKLLLSSAKLRNREVACWCKLYQKMHENMKKFTVPPPAMAAILGFIFGSVPWLKKLIVGDDAPLRVIQDSVRLLSTAAIPCITLILGGNLKRGLQSSKVKPKIIISIVCVRYIILPVAGIGIVTAANKLGFLPEDPLFRYVLMLQYTVPPAMAIGTMVQLFNISHQECSIILLWTYMVATLAITGWSIVYMYLVS